MVLEEVNVVHYLIITIKHYVESREMYGALHTSPPIHLQHLLMQRKKQITHVLFFFCKEQYFIIIEIISDAANKDSFFKSRVTIIK